MTDGMKPHLRAVLFGAPLMIAGAVILRINPPLPEQFGGSFGPSIRDLSVLGERIGAVAILVGAGLMLFGIVRWRE